MLYLKILTRISNQLEIDIMNIRFAYKGFLKILCIYNMPGIDWPRIYKFILTL